jgi:hypothetical protein
MSAFLLLSGSGLLILNNIKKLELDLNSNLDLGQGSGLKSKIGSFFQRV